MTRSRRWQGWVRALFTTRRVIRRRPRLQLVELEDRATPATSAFLSMPTNLAGNQGTVVTVPVSIGHLFDANGNQGLHSADVVLTYDPTVFTVANADVTQGALITNPPPNGTWTFAPNTATPGEVDITVASPSPAADVTSQTGGVLANINFHIKGAAPTGNSTIHVVVPPETSPNGLFSDALPHSGPNSIQGNSSGYTMNPADQVDGVVNVQNFQPITTLSIPTNQPGLAGHTILVPVNISNPDPNGSAGMVQADAAILFNKNLVSVANVTAGSVIPATGWTVSFGIDTTHVYLGDPNLGALALHIFNNNSTPLTSTNPGSLWQVTFTIANNVAGTTPLNLVPSAQVLASTTTTNVTGANKTYDLNPAPTNGNDAIDGSINISSTNTTHYTVIAPSTATAGTSFNFVVTALTATNAIDTQYTNTVHFTSSDGQAILPNEYTFTTGAGGDNGVHTFTATLKTAGTQTIHATDTAISSITGTSNNITVNPAAATHFSLSAPSSATAGSTFSFTVTAQDQFNNTDTGYGGTVDFSSTSAGSLPNPSTLTNGSGSFNANLINAGNKTITATDTANSSITGTSNTIAVSAAAATHFGVSAPSSATAGSAFTFTVTAQDPFSNTDTTYAGTVDFSGTSAGSLPNPSTLTNGTGTFTANLVTAGSQTITATDRATIVATPNGATEVGNTVTITTAAAHGYAVGQQVTISGVGVAGYNGTFTITSIPTTTTFTYTAAATGLAASGGGTVTSGATGTSNTITVSAAAATHFGVSAPSTATAGSAFNFTVTAQDQFNNTATGYAGTVHLSSSDGAATLPPNATLANGTGTLSATLLTAGPQTITATDTANSSITGTSSSITVSASAGLAISVAGPATVIAGTQVTYTLSLTNAGPSDAANVTLTDTIPTPLFFATFTAPPGWNVTAPVTGSRKFTATLASLPAGASAVFTLVAFSLPVPVFESLTNTASVTSTTTDSTPADESDSVTSMLVPQADLSVGTTGPATATAGTNVTYTITLANTGPSDVFDVTLSDTLTAGVTFVSFTPSSTDFFVTTPPVGGTGTITAINSGVNAGSTFTFTLVVRVNPDAAAGTTVTNTASATIASFDTNPANNSSSTTTSVLAAADLAVTNAASPDPVTAGNQLTYTLSLTNKGPSDAQSITLTDALPAGTTFVSLTQATSGPAFAFTTPPVGGKGPVLGTLGTLAAGASATVTLVVRVDPGVAGGTVLSNTATAASATTDANPRDNSTTATATVAAGGDVGVTIFAITQPDRLVIPGHQITYTIRVTNAGPGDQTGVSVADVFPSALSSVGFTSTATGGATGNTASGAGDIHDTVNLPSGGSITYTVTGTIRPSATGPLSDTVTVAAAAGTDPNPANDTAASSLTLTPLANIIVTVTGNPDPVVSGNQLTYTLTVRNEGPSDAQNVTLTDAIPAGATFVSFTAPAGWTTSTPAAGGSGTVTATLPSLAAASGDLVFTLVVRVTPTQQPGATLTDAAAVNSPTGGTDILFGRPPPPPDQFRRATTTTRVLPFPRPIVVGTGPGVSPQVKVFDPITGRVTLTIQPYESTFTGGVDVAVGDVTGDGIPDIVTGPGPGGGPVAKVFDGVTGKLVRTIMAYDPGYRLGVTVTAGDVDGDGLAEVIVGTDAGGGPEVAVFSGKDRSLLAAFFAYEASFRGGVDVAAADVNGDGKADIVTGAMNGGSSHVVVFNGTDLAVLLSIFAYDPLIRGGVFVAAADVNGDGRADVITGDGATSPEVKVFDGLSGEGMGHFFAFDPNFRGGANVGVADFHGDGFIDLVVAPGSGGGPNVKVFDPLTQAEESSFFAFDPAFTGGVFVG
jgi:uncharacterized repeat protein (TIGR01451 family)